MSLILPNAWRYEALSLKSNTLFSRRRGAVVTALTKLAVPRADQDYRRDVGSNPIGAASRRG